MTMFNRYVFLCISFVYGLHCQENSSPACTIANLATTSICDIKKQYAHNPAEGDYWVGVKILNGLGVPEPNPETAFKFFLRGRQFSDSTMALLQICRAGFCNIPTLEEQLLTLEREADEGNVPTFNLLYILAQSNTLPATLTTRINNFLDQVVRKNPKLLYDSATNIAATLNKEAQFSIKNVTSAKKTWFEILQKLDEEYHFLPATILIGDIYKDGLLPVKKPNPQRALEYYLKAANRGSAHAQYLVAIFYLQGKVTRDAAQALTFMEKSAAQNFSLALYNMGVFYLQGTMVPQDLRKTFSYFERAANLNNSDAMLALGKLAFNGLTPECLENNDPNYEKAFNLIKKAYDLGDKVAAFDLAFFYKTGIHVPQDLDKAQQLYQEVLNSSDDYSAFNSIARMYEFGIGTDKDLEKAREYYTRIIEVGNVFYQRHLDRVINKIQTAALKTDAPGQHAEVIEIPEISQQHQRGRTSSTRHTQRVSPEQIARDRRRSDENKFKDKLNETFVFPDESKITDVNFEQLQLTITRPSDETQAILEINQGKINKKRRKKVKKFDYQPRVDAWFAQLPEAALLDDNEYASMIRHAFPQMVDAIAQLFGYRTIANDRLTLAINGTLIPGKTKMELPGTFIYGYNDTTATPSVYHRFLHKKESYARTTGA